MVGGEEPVDRRRGPSPGLLRWRRVRPEGGRVGA
jgi:hypothetical protein